MPALRAALAGTLATANENAVSGSTLLDALIQKIQTGELDLTPRQGAGFYDQQLYALETLLVPEKSSESQHLLLTRAYKEKLVETFKSLLIQTRETHVKQIGLVNATAASSASWAPIEFTVYPKLPVEPFPTFYLRTARAYRFLEDVASMGVRTEHVEARARRREQHDVARLRERARLDHGIERLALMRRIALHGLDQIGNEVVPLLELDVDIGEGLAHTLTHRDEAVVNRDRPENEADNHDKHAQG